MRTRAVVPQLITLYLLYDLVQDLGGLDAAAAAFAAFRAAAAQRGIPCIHLQAQDYGVHPFGPSNWPAALAALGIDSVTAYTWIHNTSPQTFPLTDYDQYAAASMAYWPTAEAQFAPVPYVPNFSVAWDPSPRTLATDNYDNWGYPCTAVVQSTPAQIQAQLETTAAYLTARCDPAWCALTVYAWNEISEGGTLEPDSVYGTGRLDAFAAVFGNRSGLEHVNVRRRGGLA